MAEYQQIRAAGGTISTTVLRWELCGISPAMGKLKDLTGQRFGRLDVLRRSAKSPTVGGNAVWLCRCDCGQQAEVRGNSLVSNKTKSCGCNQMTAARAARTFHTVCTVQGCSRRHLAKGYCRLHYQRFAETGSVDSLSGDLRGATAESRFNALLSASGYDKNGCLVWVGSKTTLGYGRFQSNGIAYRAYRFAYEQANGPVPSGMEVCHSCDNPSCVNPEHLFVGTTRDNAEDREAKGRGNHAARRKPFAFVSPQGEIVRGVGLMQFCAERGLLQPKMSQVLHGSRRHHKGWTRHG